MRGSFIALSIPVLAVAIVAACSFPSPEIRDPNSSNESTTTSTDGGGGNGDVAVPTGEKPDTGPCADPCDCDRDKYISKLCDAGPGVEYDCDDSDPRAHPNADFVSDAPVKPTDGNWDCKDPLEKQYAEGVTCVGKVPNSNDCNATQGFKEKDIPCGVEADFVTCATVPTATLPACQGTISRRTQGCR